MDILATTPPQTIAESNQQLADEITLLAGQSNVAGTIRSSEAVAIPELQEEQREQEENVSLIAARRKRLWRWKIQ